MNKERCMCGDPMCPSCGRAMGTYPEKEIEPDPDQAHDDAMQKELDDKQAATSEFEFGCPTSVASLSPTPLTPKFAKEELEQLSAQSGDGLVGRLARSLAEQQRHAPLCKEHGSGPGTRSGCPYCGLIKMSAALSRIDYLCGEPNDMEVSGYDVHCNEDAVVRAVERLVKRLEPE